MDALCGAGTLAVGFLQRVGGLLLQAAAAFEFEGQALFDVFVAGDGVLGLLQRVGGGALVGFGRGGVLLRLLRLALGLGAARLGGFGRSAGSRRAHLGGGGGVLQAGHGGVDGVAALAAGGGLFFQLLQRSAQRGQAFVQPGQVLAQRLDGGAVGGAFLLDALAALARTLKFGVGFVDAEPLVLALVFEHGGLALAAGVGLGQGADVGVGLLDLQHHGLRALAQRGALRVKVVELAAQPVVVGLGGLVLALLVAQRLVGAADGVHPQRDFEAFAHGGQFQELLRLLAVALEGADTALQLAKDVAQALKVRLGGGQAALGLVFAVAVLGDAGRFLKNFAALGRFGADDGRDAPLADDGVAVAPQAGIEQQLIHVLEADALAVDGILALAAAVVAAADGDFVGVDVEAVVGVVDGQRHRGVAHGPAGLGAAEDDVLHLAGTAQLAGARLAQDPADGVGNIGFARAVGPHDAGDAGADGEPGAVGEGFEALDLQFFQAHGNFLFCVIGAGCAAPAARRAVRRLFCCGPRRRPAVCRCRTPPR